MANCDFSIDCAISPNISDEFGGNYFLELSNMSVIGKVSGQLIT